MSKNLKIFLGLTYLLLLFSFLYFIFTVIEIGRLNDFTYYKELQSDLNIYISSNVFINFLLKDKFGKYIDRFQQNEFYYFLAFRFSGGLGIPFGLQNLIPVLFDMKKINYFFSSFLGFIPSMFIMNTIGAGLDSYIESAEIFSVIDLVLAREIYLPILFFISLMIFSLIIKKKFFDNAK